MTTVITPQGGDNGTGTGMILGIILVVVLLILFFVYGLPALQGNPDTTNEGTTIEVPDDINVDVNTGGEGSPEGQ